MPVLPRLDGGSIAGFSARPRQGGWLTAAVMTCAAFGVLLGVLLMHSVPMVHPPSGHSAAGPTAVSALHPDVGHHAETNELAAAVMAGSGVVLEMGCSDGCSPHVGMAMCMAVITIATALIVVRRLLDLRENESCSAAWALVMGGYASRAPPWAAPSVEKLSVLRI